MSKGLTSPSARCDMSKKSFTHRLVYIGLRQNGQQFVHAYRLVMRPAQPDCDDQWVLGSRTMLWKTRLGHAPVGGVVSVESPVDVDREGVNQVYTLTAKYMEMWRDKDDVEQWSAQTLAHEAEKVARAQARGDKRKYSALNILNPLVRTYRQLGPLARAALIARVIHYIVNGHEPSTMD